MHRTRLITALILTPLLIAYIMLLPPIYFLILMIAVALVGQLEFYTLFGVEKKYRVIGLLSGIALFVLVYRDGMPSEDFIPVVFIIVAVLRLFSKRSPDNSLKEISDVITGVIYVPFLLSYQIKLREFGPEWIIYLDSCVWAADSLAYYMGRSLGKKKLYETVSPNKTIVGAYGSVIGAVTISIVFNFILSLKLSIVQAVVLGVIIGIVSIIGDLVESMFKRDSGIKDSGNIIPGHGGILDKIDGIVVVSPVLYWIVSRVILL
jgi:phosphatidate cytidylyltransferase